LRSRIVACLLGLTLASIACTDISAPHDAARRYVGHPPSNSMSRAVDWYQCSSIDGGQTWSCQYEHTDSTWTPDFWDPDNVFHTTGDCSLAAQYCDNNFQPTGGSSPYTDPREVGRASPTDYTNLVIPVCPASQTASQAYKAYCAGHAPNAGELTLIRAALDRMRQIGGICSTLAAIGDALLAHSPPTLHVYPQGAYTISGHAPVGGGSSGVRSWTIVSQDLTSVGYDASHYLWFQNGKDGLWYKATLQTVLAHELDHLHGADGHVTENSVVNLLVTTNTRQCSDVDMGPGLVTHQ
jgi:hypothetical protein